MVIRVIIEATANKSASVLLLQKKAFHWAMKSLQAILVCFLAYVLWTTLGRMVKSSGLGDEPRRVLNELSKINLVDVVLPTSEGVEIRKRCITRPTDHQEILLQYLGLKIPLQFVKK